MEEQVEQPNEQQEVPVVQEPPVEETGQVIIREVVQDNGMSEELLVSINDNLVTLNNTVADGIAWIVVFQVLVMTFLLINLFFSGLKAGRSND